MKINNKVYINHFDAITCAGSNAEELFNSICEKKDCISINNHYIPNKSVALGKLESDESFYLLLKKICKGILEKSNLKNYENTLLIVGSSVGGMKQTEDIFFKENSYKNIDYKEHPINAIAYNLQKDFTFYDDISFSTACTSSTNAIGYAKEVISKGIYKNVLVVGIDSLSYTTVCGFSALSVLSSKPCTPFEKNREGMNVAEGIGVLLIQNRKEKNSVEICSVGYSSDAHHMTQPHPDGEGAFLAMQNAINNAKIDKRQVSYINAHGTGTIANDNSEIHAINRLFPYEKPIVSSTKSITGHCLGAAGAIEAIISAMVIIKGIIPPSKNITEPEINIFNYSNESIRKSVKYVLSNSFAFGGNNTSLLFGKIDED